MSLPPVMPYGEMLGIKVVKAGPELVVSRLEWREELCTANGIMHGGALMSLADSSGGICAFLNLPENAATTTIESKTNLLRAVKGGVITATSTPLHVGRTVIAVETRVTDADGKLVSLTIQTQAVLKT